MSRIPPTEFGILQTNRSEEQLRYTLLTCPERYRHTPCPEGYVEWHEWAERKSVRHQQVRCPACGLFAIWKRKS